MAASLTIDGLYEYDPTIFDEMSLPEGVDKQNLIDNIILMCDGLELLYPTAPGMKRMIKLWSKKWLPSWTRMKAAADAEYNPLDNYDRTETTEAWGEGSSRNTTTSTGSVSAYNSQSFEPRDETVTVSESEPNTLRQHGSTRIHGNIGVTSSMQLVQAEMDLVPNINMINIISNMFKDQFCLEVY